MIDSIHLSHFKCFSQLDLPLGRLTLLTGRNATGKSSVIQSLLLLHQALVKMNRDKCIPLNGDLISLGAFGDILDGRSGRQTFSMGVASKNYRLDWICQSDDKTALVAPLVRVADSFGWSKDNSDGVELLAATMMSNLSSGLAFQLTGALQDLLYVSTERIGPRETYAADPNGDAALGARGEHTAWYLNRNGERPVPEPLRRPDTPPQLLRQTEAWLAYFFPGAALQVERIRDTNLLTLRFQTSARDNFHRPGNVGYGLSHLLPVLVGGLGVKAGSIFIVENPEAHLHPSAQAQIGAFLATVVSAGAQVLIETHSDHVLNGIRIAVKKHLLTPEQVRIHYFNPRDAESQVVSPVIRPDGSLDQWPEGFFDQIGKDLDELTEW